MWNTIKHLLILLTVIGVVAASAMVIINNSSTAGFEPQGGSAAGFQPPSGEGQPQTPPDQQSGDQPVFQGSPHEREGGSSFGAMELLKNLGIIAVITAVIVLLEKVLGWFKRSRKAPASLP